MKIDSLKKLIREEIKSKIIQLLKISCIKTKECYHDLKSMLQHQVSSIRDAPKRVQNRFQINESDLTHGGEP